MSEEPRIGPFKMKAVKELVAALNEMAPNEWAFTGSFGMYLIADDLGVESRVPNDIDVIVSKGKFGSILEIIHSLGYTLLTKTELRIMHRKFVKEGLEVDVLGADNKFGKMTIGYECTKEGVEGCKIIDIKQMISLKQEIADDCKDFDDKYEYTKAVKDIEILKRLQDKK